jgi:hypothetical protein
MEITQASIEQLNDVAFLFNQYRIFYRQLSDLDSAQKFIRERLLTAEYHYVLKI